MLSPILVEGQPIVPMGQRPLAQWGGATPDYFRTLAIPLLRGRYFTWADDEKAPRVVIVNESLARHFWPNQSALGKHITFTRFQAPFEVVGVVGDTRSRGLEVEAPMAIYSAYAQWTWQSVSLTLRTAGDPRALTKALSAMVAAVDRDQPVTNIRTHGGGGADCALAAPRNHVPDRRIRRRRTDSRRHRTLRRDGLCGGAARRRRSASARRSERSAPISCAWCWRRECGSASQGIVIGVIAAAALTRLLGRMLFHVSATDPLTFGAIAAIFLAVSLAACVLPAWRATRIDPLEALRSR